MNYRFQEAEKRAHQIAYLISGYITKSLTTREHDELDAWAEDSDDNMELFANLTDEKNVNQAMTFLKSVDKDSAYERIKAQIFPGK